MVYYGLLLLWFIIIPTNVGWVSEPAESLTLHSISTVPLSKTLQMKKISSKWKVTLCQGPVTLVGFIFSLILTLMCLSCPSVNVYGFGVVLWAVRSYCMTVLSVRGIVSGSWGSWHPCSMHFCLVLCLLFCKGTWQTRLFICHVLFCPLCCFLLEHMASVEFLFVSVCHVLFSSGL